MGTLAVYDFEGVNGATVSGSGITLSGTGQAIYDPGFVISGSMGVKCTANAGLTKAVQVAIPVPATIVGADAFIKLPTLPVGVRYAILHARRSGGVQLRVELDSNGGLSVVTSGRIDPFVTSGLVPGQGVRLSLLMVAAAQGASSAQVKCYTSGANWTTQVGTTFNRTDLDLGAVSTAFNEVAAGSLSGATPGLVTYVDYIRVEDGRVTEFSPPPVAGATTAALAVAGGSSQYPEVGESVGLTTAGSAGSGTLTYSTTCTARSEGAPSPQINNGNTASPTVVIPVSDFTATPPVFAGAQYEITCTVTGAGGSAAAAITLYAHEHPGDKVGVHSVTSGLWTNEGGAPTPVVALNDSASATKMESPNPAVSTALLTGIMRPFGAQRPLALTLKSLYKGSATNLTISLYLEDGTTLVDDDTWPLDSTEAAHERTVDAAGNTLLGTSLANCRALRFAIYGS